MESFVKELIHSGILGMRWGVRRKRGPDGLVIGTSGSKTKEPNIRTLSKKQVRNLSDADLKKYIARMQDEENYMRLSAKNQPIIKKTIDKVLKSAAESGLKQLTPYMDKQMGKLVKTIISKQKKKAA